MSKDEDVHPLTELALIATKAGIGLFPGGGTLTAGFEALHLLSREAAKQWERRSEKRFVEFISSVFKGEVSPEITEFLTADDYHALLSGCMADLESEKSKYYGQMAAAIGRGDVQERHRRYLIIALTHLSEAQLQMLRRSWIASHFRIRPQQGSGTHDSLTILNLGDDPLRLIEHGELVTRHLYTDNHTLSVFGDALVEACFDHASLEPSSIGAVEWHPAVLDIIYDKGPVRLITALSDLAWNSAIRTTNRSIVTIDRAVPAVFISPRVVVLEDIAPPHVLEQLRAKLSSHGALFVTYQDQAALIRKYFPRSVILRTEELSDQQVAEYVIAEIRRRVGW